MSVLTSLLVRDRVLSISKVEEALERQVLEGGEIETILLEQGLMPEDTLAAFRAALFGLLPATREEVMGIPREVLKLVPRDLAIKARIIPLQRDGNMLLVAASEPPAETLRREIESTLGDGLSIRIVNTVRIEGALAHHYGVEPALRSLRLLDTLRRREPGAVPYVRPPGPSLRPSLVPPAQAIDLDPVELPDLELPPPRELVRPEAPVDLEAQEEIPVVAPEREAAPAAPQPRPFDTLDRSVRLSSVPPASVSYGFAKALRGPLTEERVLELLAKAEQRDDVLYALLRYASQFFDFIGIFSVAKDGARGRMASASRLPAELMEQVMLPLTGPGTCARAVREKRALIGDPTATDEERAAFALLGRSGGFAAGFLPVTLGTRVVLLVYADRDSEALGLDDLEPIAKLVPAVADALRRIILESKALHSKAPPPSEVALSLSSAHTAAHEPPAIAAEPSTPVASPEPLAARSSARPLPAREPTLLGTSPVKPEPEVSVVDFDRLAFLYAERRRETLKGGPPVRNDLEASPELKAAARQRLLGVPRTAPPPPERESLAPASGRGAGGYSITAKDAEAVRVGRASGAPGPGPLGLNEAKTGATVIGTPVAQIKTKPSTEAGGEVEARGPAPREQNKENAPTPEPPPAPLRTAPADNGKADTQASVIVNMGDQISILSQGLLAARASEEPAQISELLAAGEAALPVLAQLFPGPLWFDRHKPHKRRPRGRDVSPVARALCAFGSLAAPYLAPIIAGQDADACFYGLLVAQEIQHPALLDAIAPRLFDADDTLRAVALDALRAYAARPELSAVLTHLGQLSERAGNDLRKQRMATEALAQLRDERALPMLLARLADPSEAIVQLAHRGLVLLTGQDFGLAQRKWETWVEQWGRAHRVEWLIDSLLHQEESIRSLAGDELKQMTQQYLGFHPQLPRRDRELVQRKYREWWEREGRVAFTRSAN